MNIEELIKSYPEGISYKISHNECARLASFLNSGSLEKVKGRLPKLSPFLISALLQPEETTVALAIANIKICCQYLQENLQSLILQELQNIQKHMKDNVNNAPTLILMVWKTLVAVLGATLHKNRTAVNTLLIIPEKCFKSPTAAIQRNAFHAWKELIDNFALDKECISHPKRLKLILQPMMSNKSKAEEVQLSRLDAWWRVAVGLKDKLHAEFEKVCVPLLKFVFQIPTDPPGKNSPEGHVKRSNSPPPAEVPFSKALLLRGCEVLLRILEFPGQSMPAGLSSPRSMPELSAQQLAIPISISTISKNSILILEVLKKALKFLQTLQPGSPLSQSIVQAMLLRMNALSKGKNKEDTEALAHFIHFIHTCVKENYTPSGLKLLDNVTRILSTKVLTSHCYHLPMTSTEILNRVPALGFLELLLSQPLFSKELATERFLSIFKRLVNAGIEETDFYLTFAQSVLTQLQEVKNSAEPDTIDVIVSLWVHTVHTLWGKVQKTQEVNQGDQLEHDFSCLLAALMLPARLQVIAPKSIQTKEVEKSWENLCRSFMRCAAMVNNTEPNVSLQELCTEALGLLETEKPSPKVLLWTSYMCGILLAGTDFQSINIQPVAASVLSGLETWRKQKQPLANVTPLVKLIALVLKLVYDLSQNDTLDNKDREVLDRSLTTSLQQTRQLLTTVTQSAASIHLVSILVPHIAPYYRKPADTNKGSQQNKQLEQTMQVLTTMFLVHFKGTHSQDTFDVLCPLLEVTLVHPHRVIQEKARSLWMAAFVDMQNTLRFPKTFKDVLKKVQPALISGSQISSVDSNTSFDQPIELEVPRTPRRKANFVLEEEKRFLSPKSTKTPETKKDKSKKKELNEDSQDFVAIAPSPNSGKRILTDHQRQTQKQKSHIPALYSDLTQDTQVSLESQNEESSSLRSSSKSENKIQEIEEKSSNVEIVDVVSKNVPQVMSPRSDDSHLSGTDSPIIIPSSGVSSREVRMPRLVKKDVKLAKLAASVDLMRVETHTVDIGSSGDTAMKKKRRGRPPKDEGKKRKSGREEESSKKKKKQESLPVVILEQSVSSCERLLNEMGEKSESVEFLSVVEAAAKKAETLEVPSTISEEEVVETEQSVVIEDVVQDCQEEQEVLPSVPEVMDIGNEDEGVADMEDERTNVQGALEGIKELAAKMDNDLLSVEIVPETETELIKDVETSSVACEGDASQVVISTRKRKSDSPVRSSSNSTTMTVGSRWKQKGSKKSKSDKRAASASKKESVIIISDEDNESTEPEKENNSVGLNDAKKDVKTDDTLHQSPQVTIKRLSLTRVSSPMSRSRRMVEAAMKKSDGQPPSPPSEKSHHLAAKSPPFKKHVYSPLASPSSSILKVNSTDKPVSPPNGQKRVSFADFPVDKEIPIPMVPISELPSRFATQGDDSLKSTLTEQELKDSEDVDIYGEGPIYPQLVGCQHSAKPLLSHLTSSMWSRGLDTLLCSKNINTVGDLSALTYHDAQGLPFKTPKVKTLRAVLAKYHQKVLKSSPASEDINLHSPPLLSENNSEDEFTDGLEPNPAKTLSDSVMQLGDQEVQQRGDQDPQMEKDLDIQIDGSLDRQILEDLDIQEDRDVQIQGDLAVQIQDLDVQMQEDLDQVQEDQSKDIQLPVQDEDIQLNEDIQLDEDIREDQNQFQEDQDILFQEDQSRDDQLLEEVVPATQVEVLVVNQEDDVVIATQDEDVMPPTQEEDAVPAIQEEDMVAVIREEEDVVPASQEDVVSTSQEDDVVPASQEDVATQELLLTQVPSGGLSALHNYDDDDDEEPLGRGSPLPCLDEVLQDNAFLESSMLGNQPAKLTSPAEAAQVVADARNEGPVNKNSVVDIQAASPSVSPLVVDISQLHMMPNDKLAQLLSKVTDLLTIIARETNTRLHSL